MTYKRCRHPSNIGHFASSSVSLCQLPIHSPLYYSHALQPEHPDYTMEFGLEHLAAALSNIGPSVWDNVVALPMACVEHLPVSALPPVSFKVRMMKLAP